MMEILAPAGSRESLLAALRCGADAVYLGLGGLKAEPVFWNSSGRILRRRIF